MRLLLATASVLAAALLPSTAAAADWPPCGGVRTTECTVSFTRNAVDVSASPRFRLTVDDALGAGTSRFQVLDLGPLGDRTGDAAAQLDPADVYAFTINTGAWKPRSTHLYGQGVVLSAGGAGAGGYTLSVAIQPVPLAWKFSSADGHNCFEGDCGGALTRADGDFSGRAEGYTTDLRGWFDPADAVVRSGFWESYNAQYHAPPQYDAAAGAFTIAMANTHLRADGARATGAYEAFLPDGLLLHYFGIVDPASVTTASLVVTRTDGSAASLAAPPTITQVPGGVTIRIAGIGYSAPTYRVFRRARALPGRVRALKATRLDVTRVQLRWRAPRSSGALPVRRFSVRCSGHAASTRNRRVRIAAGAGTTCTVRARSAVGLGPVTRVRV